jgi:hypothetical protein
MKSSEAFPSKYLKSADVKDRPVIATISYVVTEPVGQDRQTKPVLYVENGRPIVLNRTNFEAIEAAFGDSDHWSGHKVKIYSAVTSFQGKRVDGIRIDPITTPVVPKAPTAEDELVRL